MNRIRSIPSSVPLMNKLIDSTNEMNYQVLDVLFSNGFINVNSVYNDNSNHCFYTQPTAHGYDQSSFNIVCL